MINISIMKNWLDKIGAVFAVILTLFVIMTTAVMCNKTWHCVHEDKCMLFHITINVITSLYLIFNSFLFTKLTVDIILSCCKNKGENK